MTDDEIARLRKLAEREARDRHDAAQWCASHSERDDRDEWAYVSLMDLRNAVDGATILALLDERDALRLAVQLQISVEFGEDGNNGPTYMAGYFTDNGNRLRYAIEHETPAQDASAATRRAIVRAAAEIGKLQS